MGLCFRVAAWWAVQTRYVLAGGRVGLGSSLFRSFTVPSLRGPAHLLAATSDKTQS